MTKSVCRPLKSSTVHYMVTLVRVYFCDVFKLIIVPRTRDFDQRSMYCMYVWLLNSVLHGSPFSLAEEKRGVEDCRMPSLGLEELLIQRAQELQGKEESQVQILKHYSTSPVALYVHALGTSLLSFFLFILALPVCGCLSVLKYTEQLKQCTHTGHLTHGLLLFSLKNLNHLNCVVWTFMSVISPVAATLLLKQQHYMVAHCLFAPSRSACGHCLKCLAGPIISAYQVFLPVDCKLSLCSSFICRKNWSSVSGCGLSASWAKAQMKMEWIDELTLVGQAGLKPYLTRTHVWFECRKGLELSLRRMGDII